MIELLPGEAIVAKAKSANYEVALTNWRIVARGSSLGADAEQTIPLDCVDSFFIGTARKSILLFLGIAVSVAFLILKEELLVVVAIALLVAWWFFAERGAQIISRSGKTVIGLMATGPRLDSVTQFLAAVQNALRERQDSKEASR